jgi:ankyrin repeat protein
MLFIVGNNCLNIYVVYQNFAYIDSLECKCRTPLMLAAAFDLPEAVSLLCSAGADVNMRDLDGNTALHYAYACSSSHAMSALEDNNANTDIANNAGNTPFDVIGLIDTISPIFK